MTTLSVGQTETVIRHLTFLILPQSGTPEPKGVYISDCQIAEAAQWATDLDAAKKLYELSASLVGIAAA